MSFFFFSFLFVPLPLIPIAEMQDTSLTIASATGLGVVGLVSTPAVVNLVLQLMTPEPRQDSYEDQDGKATPESFKAYSAKWPKSLIVLFSLITASTSLATAVLATLHVDNHDLFLENWLSVGASVSCPLPLPPGILPR